MAFEAFLKRDQLARVALFTVQRDNQNNIIDEIIDVFDAVADENHSSSVRISQHPVEDGSNIADNAYVEPLKLTIQGVRTNHPIELLSWDNLANLSTAFATGGLGNNLLYPKDFRNSESPATLIPAQAGVVGQLGLAYLTSGVVTQTSGGQPTVPENRAERAYQVLFQRQLARNPISIATGLRIYSNMMITEIQTKRNAQNAHSWVASVTFEEIRVVKTQKDNVYGVVIRQQPTGDNAEEEEGTKDKLKVEDKKGKKGSNKIKQPQTAKSVLANFADGTGGTKAVDEFFAPIRDLFGR